MLKLKKAAVATMPVDVDGTVYQVKVGSVEAASEMALAGEALTKVDASDPAGASGLVAEAAEHARRALALTFGDGAASELLPDSPTLVEVAVACQLVKEVYGSAEYAKALAASVAASTKNADRE